jgi:YidC/Oxa1 family membrane protein insertase
MIDKRLFLAVALSVAFLIVWTYLFTPPRPAVPPGVGPSPSPVPGATSPPAATPGAPGAAAEPASGGPDLSGLGGVAGEAPLPDLPPGRAVLAAIEEEVTVQTPLATIRFTNRGARVTSWRLKDYLDDDGRPLELVSPAGRKLDHLPLQLLLEDADATRALRQALYRVERRDGSQDGRRYTEVSFAYSDAAGLSATKAVRLEHESYVAALSVAAEAGGRPVVPTVVWGAGFGPHTGRESGQYADAAHAVVNLAGVIERRTREQVKPEAAWLASGAVVWAGLEDKYFAALIVPPEPALGRTRVETLRLVEEGREHFFLSFALQVPGASRTRLFVGPKDYDLLRSLGLGLEPLVDFGFFSFIALPLFYAMKFLERYVGNFGWAIVVLTVVIRLLFFPFLHRGQLKMRKMQDKMKRVQPKVKAMRERYHRLERKEIERGNAQARYKLRQQMNQEMMDLYKQEGINPLGQMSGCLPLLLQIPILYAFYTILSLAIELRKAPFVLWIRDLSQKDPYYVTPIVMGVTMVVQQAMTSSSIPDPTQRRIMYLMPVMFTYFFIHFPSGLVLYWLVNNLLGIAQQYLVNRQADAEARTPGS